MTGRARIAVLLCASVALLAGCMDDDPSAKDPAPASGSTNHHSSDHTDSPEPTGSTGGTTDTVTVPIYFVGDTPQGPRLYREFRKVEAADPLDEALTLAASGDALDPDYGTLLPTGTFSGATFDEPGRIPLPDDSWTRRPAGMSQTDALLAVQQLVYTAQGVLQQRRPIEFTDADGNATQTFGIASEDGFTAADPIDTLALMSVTSPEEGQTVSGSFTATGVGSSFEATVRWEIRRGDAVVTKGFTTAEGWMDKLYPWKAKVVVSGLEPGEYTFVAMTDDPSDGEGAGPTQDSKSITVE
jgi:Immunoglobulin-like domain of bacterial spore germination